MITERSVYDVKCRICGRRESFPFPEPAKTFETEHASRHANSEVVGPTLEGKVYDTNAPDAPYLGRIDFATKAAGEAGYRYLSWNGHVYPVGAVDFNLPTCWASDVPGFR